jgi:hypothetical protein
MTALGGTKRTFKVLRRRSDVEGRADMARTLPEGDPRYATDFLPRMDGAGCPPGGGGALGSLMAALAAPLPGTNYARARWSTLVYVEKVRSQFLSLRHPYSAPRFLHRWMGRKSPVNWGISIAATVLEIAELRHFSLGDGIFLRSFVLCGFSIVSKSEVPEGQLETKFAPGSNPGWMSERN